MPTSSTNSVLEKLRTICLELSGASETVTFGHATFQVARKAFVVLEEYKGELGIALNVGKLMQGVFLKDPRFFMTPYAGKHGWVTLRVHAAPLDWKEIRELVEGCHHLVSVKKTSKGSKRV